MKLVILHNVRSKYNVGAVFRTADAAGVEKIYLTGYTPTPRDRFGRLVPEIEKTSLGASLTVPWEQVDDVSTLVASLQAKGVTVVAVEVAPQSVSLYDFQPPAQVAYLFGSETAGVPTEIQDQADVVLSIPMLGQKESLNVSVTVGVVVLHHPYAVPKSH